MRKEGMSHIEVIFSFVIFIAAIGLVLYLFNPFEGTKVPDAVLKHTLRQVSENISTPVEIYSVKINKSNNPPEVIALKISPAIPNLGVSAESYEGEVLNASREREFVYLEWKNHDFVYIKFAEYIAGNLALRPEYDEKDYQVSVSFAKKAFSAVKLQKLNESYYADYEKTKGLLGIPGTVDFGFGASWGSNELEATKKTLSPLEVYAESLKGEFLNSDGTSAYGEIRVRVW